MSLITGGASKAASVVDDAGRCANWLTKFVHGGCFVAGTKVTVSELPYSEARESNVWSETDWLSNNDYSFSPSPRFGEKGPGDEGLGSEKLEVRSVNSSEAELGLLTYPSEATSLLIPIEQVPLGARVPTKNPKPWEYDDSLPDPVQADWAKIAITMHRNDGGIVDAELLRPRWWIAQHSIVAGKHLPMNIEELQVKGTAMVTSIDDCPEIADGEGCVVTATFKTREVHSIVRAEILGPDGSIENIEGTPIHPIWSVDRNDWVSLGELTEGTTLQCIDGMATVMSLACVTCSLPVYNIEVHGEHVYQVGGHGVLVHNTYADVHHIATHYGKWGEKFKSLFEPAGLALQDAFNKVRILGHKGPHGWYNQYVYDRLSNAVTGATGADYRRKLVGELLELRWELKNTDLGDLVRASAGTIERILSRP
jgi:hypothetical protein